MRIAILADPIDNQSAGIHHYTLGMVKGLGTINSKHEYFVVRPIKAPAIGSIPEIIVNNYSNIPGYKAFRMFIALPYLLSRWKMDVVVEPAHFGPFNLPEQIRRVTVIHDLTPLLFPQYHRWHSQTLQRIFLKSILRKAKLVIANSAYTMADIQQRFPFTQDKTNFIYPGTHPAYMPVRNPEIPLKYGIHAPYFISVGTIEPRKNLDMLLDAFAMLCESSPGTTLPYWLICGQKGWKSESFFRKLQSHPNRQQIKLTGYVAQEDLPALYTHATALLMPSLYEGFGMPLTEAMACGTPCIVSASSCLPETGGDAALVCDPHQANQWAETMEYLLENPQKRLELSDKALERAGLFSWEIYARTFDREMDKLA
ncbi:MAG: glycosyltransferase family 4 protein [Bacteroidetes bacterium]|nr:glycosyltransferase family 4 protein [Bacteroidota bacterium]